MKKILIIALVALMAISLFACSKEEEQPEAAPEVIVENEGIVELEETPAPEAPVEEPVDQGPVSPTTGLPGNTEYRPVIVQIDNEATGRPQYGIQQADIVYESMIEGADTRLTALFNDNLPEKVGPVRSARVYHQLLASEWDAIFIHVGGPYVAGFKDSYIYSEENGNTFKVRIDGTRRQYDDILWNESVGIDYCSPKLAVEEYGYERKERDPLFKFDANVDYSAYKTIEKVGIPFISSSSDHYEYVYDAATDKFKRFRFGKEFDDADSGQIEVQNVIVEYAERTELPNEGGRILMGVLGSGKAEFFVGGKHMTGTWQKDGVSQPTIYRLDNGDELVLKPGNTWIEIQPDSKSITVTYEDGSVA